MLSLFLVIAHIAYGVRLLWILYISLAKLILYIEAKEDQLAFFKTSALDISQGSSRIILAALQCSASNALKASLFVRPPHTDIPSGVGDHFGVRIISGAVHPLQK